MGKVALGTEATQVVVFNSGYLTVGSSRLADVENVSISNSFDVKSYRTLNSIKKRAIRRATLEQSIKCTIKGFMKDVYRKWFSASSPVTGGTEYSVKDGQQDVSTVYLTCYDNDDVTKTYQYQVVNPIFGSYNVDLATEDFASTEVDIMCTEIKLVVDTAAEA